MVKINIKININIKVNNIKGRQTDISNLKDKYTQVNNWQIEDKHKHKWIANKVMDWNTTTNTTNTTNRTDRRCREDRQWIDRQWIGISHNWDIMTVSHNTNSNSIRI